MKYHRLILPEWARDGIKPPILEGEFTEEELFRYNQECYNIHHLPNYPTKCPPRGTPVKGSDIDVFHWVFADMDLKSGVYPDKDSFIIEVLESEIPPTKIIDSGNGIHSYWRVTDLDPMSFLKLQRRITRRFNTDEAVAKIFQLMRPAGYVNTKHENEPKLTDLLYETDKAYTCEELDNKLPLLTPSDEAYCKQHYDKTYGLTTPISVKEKIPLKFTKLMSKSNEIKLLWSADVSDRSAADFRLGHLLYSHGFTKDEAMSVLINTAKASSRGPAHRVSYAQNIVEKIWEAEETGDPELLELSSSVKDLLYADNREIEGQRLSTWKYFDSTEKGFRRGHVLGLIAGSGVGKTTVALNMFMGFVRENPDLVHFFIPLEQRSHEIAETWKIMCGPETHLYEKVQILSNYAPDGSYRHLSLSEIRDYISKFQKVTGKKVGAVVIDHIGVLNKSSKQGESQGLIEVCKEMKAFAIHTDTLLIMQSQAPREKAGIGDIELDKDAAYGTVFFESFCDYVITVWQPSKRMYKKGADTVIGLKFCKIRHKNQKVDKITEDVPYMLYFDPETKLMREMTEKELVSAQFFVKQATQLRKQDKKTDEVIYTRLTGSDDGKVDNDNDDREAS